jgi:WD40 repeat protein
VIQAIACHPRFPYVGALSTDRHVSLWRYDSDGTTLEPLARISLRFVHPDNDSEDVPYVHSTSQAIGFHDKKLRLVTRSANAGLLEIEFSQDGTIRVLQCRRLHHDADLISVRYVKDSDSVLSGSIDGQFVLSDHAGVVRRWQLGGGNVHWAEYVCGSTYLLASDLRFVARVDISGENDVLIGEQFTRDDLEHVTFNQCSHRAFVGSFDRNIYEIDPENCLPTRIAFRAPFKCRWVKTLEHEASTAIVQCRDGGLYKVNVDTEATLGVIKSTPQALWTCVSEADGSLVLTGEGDRLLRLQRSGYDAISRVPRFSTRSEKLGLPDDSYTKRAVRQAATGHLYLARTSGNVYAIENGKPRLLATMDSAVRDIAVEPGAPRIFVVCEDGSAHALDATSGERLNSFRSSVNQPFWSLAYNPERCLLAVAERGGGLFVLDADTFAVRICGIDTARAKRMKWVDGDTLLYNYKDEIRRLNVATGRRDRIVDCVGNTIEDFIWDEDWEYLIFISYTQNLYMSDFETGEILNWIPDQMDYSKGLAWIEPCTPSDYHLDFVTFGRSGSAHLFRIHDEKILALGPIGE